MVRAKGSFRSRFEYPVAALGVAVATLLLIPLRDNVNSATVSLCLLLTVLAVATLFGSGPALLASLLALFSFNFFFLPPIHTLTIADPQNWVAFTAFVITSLIAGQLSSYARRRADEANRQREEIEKLYRDLQAAFEQASEAEALRRSEMLKSALLDAVTHDLRTPLTSIKAAATTLIEDADHDERKETFNLDRETRLEFLEIINEETDRLNTFIGGMVELARGEAGQRNAPRVWTPLEEIVNSALDRARKALESYHITVDFERDLPSILTDAVSVSEVLYSLLDNAAKYSPKGSKIRITLRHMPDAMIEFSVEDEGVGIAEEKRERVFDKFFRAEDADIHTTGGGIGLGLAIARGIVESQGGRIWIEDGRDGFATRVAFAIPVGDDD